MKKILITGGAGFIGSQLTDFLLRKNCDVTVVDNLSWGKKEFFSHNIDNKYFHFIKLDLLNKKKLNQLFPSNIDTVFHLAANSDIKRGGENPQMDFENTTKVTYNVLEVMRKKRLKKYFICQAVVFMVMLDKNTQVNLLVLFCLFRCMGQLNYQLRQ